MCLWFYLMVSFFVQIFLFCCIPEEDNENGKVVLVSLWP